MSSLFLRDGGGLAPFDCSDTAGISARWERWLRDFELFKPQANVPYKRLSFREMIQLSNETLEQFMTKLTQKAQSCEFGEYAVAVDEQIRDQVINHCLSHNIRRKLLEKGKILTSQQLREIVRVMEDSEKTGWQD